MEVTVIKSGNGAAEITVNEKKLLAVTTSLNSKIYKQISRQELLSEPGLMIRDGISAKWECTESIEYEGILIFPGPHYEGRTLADIDPDIDILLSLAITFQTIIRENIPVADFYPPGIFIPTGGGILFFPPHLINYITSQLPESESIKFRQPFNHPDAHGEEQFSFILGVLAYKLLTGKLPYTGISITEIREKMRTSRPVEVQLLKPGIDNNIFTLINNALTLNDVKLEDWTKQLKLWQKRGAINTIIGETEHLQIQKSAEKKQTKRQKQFERKQFFSRNWKTLAAAVAVLVLVISFSIQPIKNVLEPPVTTGMSAVEVVGAYYSAIIDMDVEIIEDCVDKGVGKSDIQEVTQLYVISKVRTGYEGKSGLISAQDWSDGMITKLDPGEQVYGIANLEITQSDNSLFYADYVRWFPNIPDGADSREILPPTKAYVRDILTLEKVKDVWIIINLERETRE